MVCKQQRAIAQSKMKSPFCFVFVAVVSTIEGGFLHAFDVSGCDHWDGFYDDSCIRIDWSWFGLKDRKPWWQGVHVCVRSIEHNETVEHEPDQHFIKTSVESTDDFHRVTSSNIVNGTKHVSSRIYECCHGYARKVGKTCKRVHNLLDVVSTVSKIGSRGTARALNITGLSSELQHGNFTIIAPSDDVMKEYLEREKVKLIPNNNVLVIDGYLSDVVQSKIRDVLRGHIIGGIHHTYDLAELGQVDTLADSIIRFTVVNNGRDNTMLLANCAEIVQQDIPSSNGLVHQVNKVLEPVNKSIVQMIVSEPQFSQLKTVLGRIGLHTLLGDKADFTLFLPTNAAFKKLDPEILNSSEQLTALLKNHMVPGILCSACIRNHHVMSMARETLRLKRNPDNKMFVNKAQITRADVMATDGIIHVIDDLLVPTQVKGVLQVAQNLGFTQAVELIKRVGLEEKFRRLRNVTLFLPTNRAIQEYFRHHDITKKEDIRDMLMYHVVTPMISQGEWDHVTSLQSLLSPYTIDVKKTSQFAVDYLQLQCRVRSSVRQRQFRGGNIHVTNQVMTPPKDSLLEVLSSQSNLGMFLRLLKKSKILDSLNSAERYTIFAPVDSAFGGLSHRHRHKLTSNETVLTQFVGNHIVKGRVCSTRRGFNHYTTLSGRNIATDGSFLFLSPFFNRPSRVVKGDVPAINGLVHKVNAVIDYQRHQSRPFFSFFSNFFDW